MPLYPQDIASCHMVITAMAQQRSRAMEGRADLEIQLQAAVNDIEKLKCAKREGERAEPDEPTEPKGDDA